MIEADEKVEELGPITVGDSRFFGEDEKGDPAAIKAMKADWRGIADREKQAVKEQAAAERVVNSWQGRAWSAQREVEHARKDRARIQNAIKAYKGHR